MSNANKKPIIQKPKHVLTNFYQCCFKIHIINAKYKQIINNNVSVFAHTKAYYGCYKTI